MIDSVYWLGGLWAAPGLLVPALLLLAVERRWTRAWRRRGRAAPLGAYVLDTVAVVAALAAVLGTLLFVVTTLLTMGRWLAGAVAQQVQRLAADPLLLAVWVAALVAGGFILAMVRGWIPLPRGRRQPEAVSPPAVGTTAAPVQLGASTDTAYSATRLVSAPPSEAEAHPVRSHGARSRPSPTAAPKPRPWMRAVKIRRPAPEAPSAETPSLTVEPAFAASTGLAMLNPRPAVTPDHSQVSAATYVPVVDEHETPALAMLNQRRRQMNERGTNTAQVQQPGRILRSAAPPPPVTGAMNGWWHVPLGATVVLVVALVVVFVVFSNPADTNISGLLPLQGAVTHSELQAPASEKPTDSGTTEPESEAPAAPPAQVPTPETLRTALVAADTLNVRAGPGLDNPVVILVQRGDQLVLLGAEQSVGESVWVHVRIGETEGWVNKSYITAL
jgi:hypothetical protein